MWNLRWVKLLYCTIVMLTYCISHRSGWLETETVTVGSSARGRRGSRCAARTGGAMRPAVNCRGHAAKTRHSHWRTAADVEARTGFQSMAVFYKTLPTDLWKFFVMSNLSWCIHGNSDLGFMSQFSIQGILTFTLAFSFKCMHADCLSDFHTMFTVATGSLKPMT